jgi:hypothetical protein
MKKYKIIQLPSISALLRVDDNTFIPYNTTDPEYIDYVVWTVNGNTADISTSVPDQINVALRKTDLDTNSIYYEFIGNRATDYSMADEDALAYKEAGFSGPVPRSVQAWADAYEETPKQAAEDVLLIASKWRDAQENIRRERLLRKKQIGIATSTEQIETALATWKVFVVAVRRSLNAAQLYKYS